MAAIEFVDVVKVLGGREVLRGVSLTVGEGELLALLGPSGSGKTTMLRLLAGLDAPTAGELRIGGRRVNELPPKARNVAMVFQTYALYPHLTVADNIGFPLTVAGVPKAVIAAKVERAAALLGLTDTLRRFPRQLSGGERQRVAMGRAVVREPDAFLFDEPLSNLDARLRLQMRAELRDLHLRLGTTTLHVTHDQTEAAAIADRVAVLNAGRIEQIATPVELYDRPANLFVAGFIGTPPMNLLAGVVEGEGAAAVFRAPAGTWPLPGAPPGRRVTLGVRPEDLLLGEGVAASVRLIEPAGADTLVALRTAGGEITALSRTRVALRPGDTAAVGFDPAAAHLFDADTGLRLASGAAPVR